MSATWVRLRGFVASARHLRLDGESEGWSGRRDRTATSSLGSLRSTLNYSRLWSRRVQQPPACATAVRRAKGEAKGPAYAHCVAQRRFEF